MWKLNTLLAAPLLVRMGRFRALLLLAVLIIITSAPYFMLMPGSWKEFILYFKVKMIADGPNSQGLWALVAMLYKRSGLPLSFLLPLMQQITFWTLAITGLVTFLNRQLRPVPVLAMWICCFYLTYRYVWEHHYVIILPLLILLQLQDRSRATLLVWALLALPTPFVFFNLAGVAMPQSQWTWQQDLLVHSKVLPVAGLWLHLCHQEVKRAMTERDLWLPSMLQALSKRRLTVRS
jgi:hypothetical protein